MTIFIVTYAEHRWSDVIKRYCDAFATLEEAKAYIQKESWNEDDYRCYDIVEKVL